MLFVNERIGSTYTTLSRSKHVESVNVLYTIKIINLRYILNCNVLLNTILSNKVGDRVQEDEQI